MTPARRLGGARRPGRRWVAGVLAGTLALGPAGAASAEELRAGMKDIGVGLAGSISHPRGEVDEITSFQLLPHLGYVATDTVGAGLVRGNLELLLEPTLIHLEDSARSSTVVGASALARWIFAGTGTVRPYLEAGAGILVGETEFRETTCEVNFLLQAGPGVLVFLTARTFLTVGYRFQHISNAGSCRFNLGINSSAVYVGASYLFP